MRLALVCRLLVGGAALSNKFTATKIAPEYDGPVLYAKDAMNGLDLANQLSQPHPRQQLITRIRSEQHILRRSAEAAAEPACRRLGPLNSAQRCGAMCLCPRCRTGSAAFFVTCRWSTCGPI